MTPEHWRKIEEILQAARDLPGSERAEFVRRKCGDDALLLQEIEKLLAADAAENDFPQEFAAQTESDLSNSPSGADLAAAREVELSSPENAKSYIGKRVGAYRLIRELGKGGMGVVFLAERADGEFEKKAAVKLIKRGMDTDFIVRRFRRERQIAAAFSHPNIARLYDGGTTDDDLPYFVMEYVEGISLLEYAAEAGLDTIGKLELFVRVCAAVAYAHRNLIIHRDLKPSNILVGEDGEPKLLDFGIAKILDPDLIDESVMPTATAFGAMTPEYASPEQIRGEEITAASDQYSLGVLLYELVTARRPYRFASRAAHEIARVICEEAPLNPSSGAFGETRSGGTFSANDESGRNLDRIILKTLRKNRAERYDSVEELARDIERLLEGKAVSAESFGADARAEGSLEKNETGGGKNSGENGRSGENGDEISGEKGRVRSFEPTPRKAAGQKSIAVLPFKYLNRISVEDEGGDYLGIGLADALITRLSNVRQFIVRPTGSVLRYKDENADSFRAGRELDVAFIIEGTILNIGARLRISVQLIDIHENSTVWARRFNEEVTDVLTLEDVISEQVVEALVPQLSTGERVRLAKRATDHPKAYEAYLRGRFHWNTFTEESFAKAFGSYQEAISFDPNYALAYAGLADYYIWLGVYGVVPPRECYPPAKNAARRAIALDGELAEAYAALGFAELCGDYDWPNAEKNLLRAIAVNPNYTVARLWYSYVLQSAGRFDAGIAEARRAVALDPLTYTNYHVLAWAYYFARRFDEAVAQAAVNIEKFPEIGLAYFTKSWFLRYLGRHEEALNASERALALSGGSLFVLLGHAQALAAAGKKKDAGETLRRIFDHGARQYLSYYQLALVYAYADENTAALAALERAFQDREGWLIWLATEPALDQLRDAPQFIDLERRIARLPIGEA